MSCGFAGNSDIYGLGIRIGYYTQAVAVWFSNFFLLREARSLRAVNNLFLFALVIAGFIYAHDARETYAVEAFLLLQIGLCLLFVSVMECTRYSTRYLKLSPERLAIRTLVLNAGMLFNILFWWHGLDIMRETPCISAGNASSQATSDQTVHGTYACYIIRTNMYGWMRTVMKVLSLSLFIWRTLRTTIYDMWRTFHTLRMKETRAAFIQAGSIIKQSECFEEAKKDAAEELTGYPSRVRPTKPHNDLVKKSSTVCVPQEGNQSCTTIHPEDDMECRSRPIAKTTVPRWSSQPSHTQLDQMLNAESRIEPEGQRSGTVNHYAPTDPQDESRNEKSLQAKTDNSALREEAQSHRPELRNREPSPRSNSATSLPNTDQAQNKSHSSLPYSPTSHYQTSSGNVTFEKVLEADTYLTSILSILPPPPPSPKFRFSQLFSRKRASTIPTAPSPPPSPSTPSPSYLRSLLTTLCVTFTNDPPFFLRLTLSLHISALQQHSSHHWPQLVERLRNDFHSPSPSSPSPSPPSPSPASPPSFPSPSPSPSPSPTPTSDPTTTPTIPPSPSPSSSPSPPLQPNWPLLALASDIQLSLIPLTVAAHIWTLMAAETLVIIVMLVVQVELTIAWNHVSGLQTLNTLGQLIPCILGVGGLVQVLWGKGKGLVRGEDERINGAGTGAADEYESAMAAFVAWKKDREEFATKGAEENISGSKC